MIRYLKHSQINTQKWDECVFNSLNNLIYTQSWYLNIVASGWEALVEDDYKAIMPLPAKKKFGLNYLIQPKFIQQLGIFSSYELTPEKVRQFIHAVPQKFLWQDYNLNAANPAQKIPGTVTRINYELSINMNYPALQKRYKENTLRNIKKAKNAGIIIHSFTDIPKFISLYRNFSKVNNTPENLLLFKNIITKATLLGHGKMMVALKQDEIIAGAYFLVDQKRITYLTSFNTPQGQESAAMFLMMDEMIRQAAGQPVTFDFEGSMIPGIARFFSGFGGEIRNYFRYRNSLARWIRKD